MFRKNRHPHDAAARRTKTLIDKAAGKDPPPHPLNKRMEKRSGGLGEALPFLSLCSISLTPISSDFSFCAWTKCRFSNPFWMFCLKALIYSPPISIKAHARSRICLLAPRKSETAKPDDCLRLYMTSRTKTTPPFHVLFALDLVLPHHLACVCS